MNLTVTVNGIPYQVEVEVDDTPAGLPPLYIGGGAAPAAPAAAAPGDAADGGIVAAPLAGLVRQVMVSPGQVIAGGDIVAMLEAMKMEIEVPASQAGRVAKVVVQAGDAVQGGDPLIQIQPA